MQSSTSDYHMRIRIVSLITKGRILKKLRDWYLLIYCWVEYVLAITIIVHAHSFCFNWVVSLSLSRVLLCNFLNLWLCLSIFASGFFWIFGGKWLWRKSEEKVGVRTEIMTISQWVCVFLRLMMIQLAWGYWKLYLENASIMVCFYPFLPNLFSFMSSFRRFVDWCYRFMVNCLTYCSSKF